jgi:UDP-N-acetylmuramoylalanine--D-glutamate ligase
MSGKHVYATYSVKLGYKELKSAYRADVYATAEDGYIRLNGEPWIPTCALARREWYNVLNLMGAMCLASGHYERGHLYRVATQFRGLAHRCEVFLSRLGREYIDSSIDTSPARTAATLTALCRPISIILGGRGKHLPLAELIPHLRRYAVRIALYSEAGEEYYRELCDSGITEDIPTMLFYRFADAVEYADGAEGTVTVLLSPAATGYGEFKSYAERGDAFRRHITDKYGHNRKEV